MPRNVRTPLLASAICALLLVPLAVLAYWFGPTARLDRAILVGLDRPDGSRSDELFGQIADLGDPVPFAVLLAAVVMIGLVARRHRETVAAVVVALGAAVTTQLLKQLLEHSRFDLQYGLHQPLSDAFPSGHTTAAAAIAAALLLVVPARLRPLAAVAGGALAAAVGLAVVVGQWHYPSDVLGAYLVVASWALAAVAVLRRLAPLSFAPAAPEWRNWHTRSTQNRLP